MSSTEITRGVCTTGCGGTSADMSALPWRRRGTKGLHLSEGHQAGNSSSGKRLAKLTTALGHCEPTFGTCSEGRGGTERTGLREGHWKSYHPAGAPHLISEQGFPELELAQEVPLETADFIALGLFLWCKISCHGL